MSAYDGLKIELTLAANSNSNEVQNCPVSSGDTLVISDIDTTMRNVTRSKDANHCEFCASKIV